MPAKKGNRYAAKPSRLRRTAVIFIPVTPAEKAAIKRAAGNQKPTTWSRDRLLEAAATSPLISSVREAV